MWQFPATYVTAHMMPYSYYTVNYTCGFWLAQASIFFLNFVYFIGKHIGLAYTQVLYSIPKTYVDAYLLIAPQRAECTFYRFRGIVITVLMNKYTLSYKIIHTTTTCILTFWFTCSVV